LQFAAGQTEPGKVRTEQDMMLIRNGRKALVAAMILLCGNPKKINKLFLMYLYNPEICVYAARSALFDWI